MIAWFRHFLRTWSVPWILFGLALALTLSSITPDKLPPLWRKPADIGTLAIAMTAVILTGGIDLSVGSIVAVSSVSLGLLYRDLHLPIWGAALGGVLVGSLAGLINGMLVAARIAPLVATLATMALYRGLAMAVVDGQRIANLPPSLTSLGNGLWLGFPPQLYLMVVVAIFFYILVHHTWIGRSLFAIGENRLAAEFAGIPVRRVECLLYVLTGTAAGLVAVMQTASTASAVPDSARGFELQAIACVVLGGTRVTGGFGSIGRTILGLATLAHLQIGFSLNSLRDLWPPGLSKPFRLNAEMQLIIVGALVILVAVVNERLAGRRRE